MKFPTIQPNAITRSARRPGFSTVEIVLAISVVGVIAAIAIPTFVELTRHTRTAEAVEKLAFLYRQSVTYWSTAREANSTTGSLAPHAFPESAALTPAAVPAGRRVTDQPGTWTAPAWQALNFSIPDGHYYSYQYDSTGSNVGAAFTARAIGDLDGNGVFSTFERSGHATPQLEIDGSSGLWINREVE